MESQPAKATAQHKKSHIRGLVILSFVAFVAAILIVTLWSGVLQKPAPKPAPLASVRITKDGFQPATLSVKQGTKVTWINTDDAMHQVAANPYPTGKDLRNLKSEILNNNQSYTYTADTVGSFGYHDQIQPTINGTLIVQKK